VNIRSLVFVFNILLSFARLTTPNLKYENPTKDATTNCEQRRDARREKLYEGDEVQVLTDLGLTLRQAKVFLVLVKCDSPTARAIATLSKIPRQDVYKVLDELLKLGLLEKQISTPTRFVAVPVDETCKFLLNRRIKKTSDLKIRTKALIRNLHGMASPKSNGEEPKLFLIPEKEAFAHRIKKCIESSQKSIDMIGPQKSLEQGFFFTTETLKKSMHRGVKIRVIVEEIGYSDYLQSFPSTLIENPHFRVRIVHTHSALRFCVYDKKEISVVLSSEHDFAKSSLLWSDCTSLVDAYQGYFESMWLMRSEPFKIEDRNKSAGLVSPI
jgi:sugar-specific transcriptional regulator TrmB